MWLNLTKTWRFTGPINAHLIYEPSSIDGNIMFVFVTGSPIYILIETEDSSLQPIPAYVWLVILPECKTSKKISFMAPTRKIEFDHVIDTRKH